MSRRLVALVCCAIVAAGVTGVLVATRSDGQVGRVPKLEAAATEAGRQLATQVDTAARVLQPSGGTGTRTGADTLAAGGSLSTRPSPGVVRSSLLADIDAAPATCAVSALVRAGSHGPGVECVESALVAIGLLDRADGVFDDSTADAVRLVQASAGLAVDGAVGPATARHLGVWVDPVVVAADIDTCDPEGRSVVVDRDRQLGWFCEAGSVAHEFPLTSAISQPDPGDYEVYAKDLNASSTFGDGPSTMTHFVAFTYGKFQGARVAFHSVPIGTDGSWVQPLESVGDLDRHGDSSGCLRVLPDDAVAIWDWLDLGGHVRVVT